MQNQENTKENEVLFVMKILTSTQFKELDKYTIGHEPVSSIDLMERAAKAIAAELKSRWTTATRFIVFAGPGNNGGDAWRYPACSATPGIRYRRICSTSRDVSATIA